MTRATIIEVIQFFRSKQPKPRYYNVALCYNLHNLDFAPFQRDMRSFQQSLVMVVPRVNPNYIIRMYVCRIDSHIRTYAFVYLTKIYVLGFDKGETNLHDFTQLMCFA